MHAHSHSHGPRGKKRLVLALSITAIWFLIELAGGFYANSLALLADAAHMLTDLGALGLSLFALKIAARPATHEKTYGYLRAEILAAFANGIFLILLGLYIFYESYQRFWAPPEVKSLPMLIVAVTGLCANLVTAGLLFGSRSENLNLRGAFLHVLGDTLGSVGAILAGVLIMVRQWRLADPVVSAMVGCLVLYSSWELVKESVDILLEGTPRHLKYFADIERSRRHSRRRFGPRSARVVDRFRDDGHELPHRHENGRGCQSGAGRIEPSHAGEIPDRAYHDPDRIRKLGRPSRRYDTGIAAAPPVKQQAIETCYAFLNAHGRRFILSVEMRQVRWTRSPLFTAIAPGAQRIMPASVRTNCVTPHPWAAGAESAGG